VLVDEYSMLCARDPHTLAVARRWMERHFASDLDPRILASAQLTVCELVTNAIVHAEGEIGLSAAALGRVLRVEVTDETPGCEPVVIRAAGDDGGGVGLRLVDSVARAWGCRSGPDRKVVWAEIDLVNPPTLRKNRFEGSDRRAATTATRPTASPYTTRRRKYLYGL
jgi:anti-sigma regulatory factor (Ser/Thr protein kinase)